MTPPLHSEVILPVSDYDLSATLDSGQAFRWRWVEEAWEGVIGAHWVRLREVPGGIHAVTARAVSDWTWLEHYLQTDLDLQAVLAAFPQDEPLRRSIAACRGLRLLRQDPWECLASFILSSTKQIVQIRQIVDELCCRFGDCLPVPKGHPKVCSFPSATRLAAASETELRACKMGFRAPNLLRTARMVAAGEVNLELLGSMTAGAARGELLRFPGVGDKIANCVLLFAYGFQEAFPVDVWVMKALRELYFPKRKPSTKRLERFTSSYFGPYAGYAQQYLFHYMRVKGGASIR